MLQNAASSTPQRLFNAELLLYLLERNAFGFRHEQANPKLCMANRYFRLWRTDLSALLLPQAVGGRELESACPPLKARVGFHPSPKGKKWVKNEGLI